MTKTELENAIRTAQQNEFHIIEQTDDLRHALNEFAAPVGMGNQWAISVDGVRYSVRYTDNHYTARTPKPAKKNPFASVNYATTPDGDFDEKGNIR